MSYEDQYQRAQKKVKKKKEFFNHLGVYIAGGVFFFGMNFFTSMDDPIFRPSDLWAVFPMLGWGMGLLIHYFSVFGVPFLGNQDEDWEEKELAKELRKIQRREGIAESESYDELDLNERQIIKEQLDDADLV